MEITNLDKWSTLPAPPLRTCTVTDWERVELKGKEPSDTLTLFTEHGDAIELPMRDDALELLHSGEELALIVDDAGTIRLLTKDELIVEYTNPDDWKPSRIEVEGFKIHCVAIHKDHVLFFGKKMIVEEVTVPVEAANFDPKTVVGAYLVKMGDNAHVVVSAEDFERNYTLSNKD